MYYYTGREIQRKLERIRENIHEKGSTVNTMTTVQIQYCHTLDNTGLLSHCFKVNLNG